MTKQPINNQTITFGTRGSALARRQTDMVAEALERAFPDLTIDIRIFTTRGDRELNKPLPQIGGKGLFTAELEGALRNGEIDLAVHSLKDLPVEDAPGLTIGAVMPREDPADVLISRKSYSLATLPQNATVGTSSLRRLAQLLAMRPDLNVIPVRGNIDTRVAKAMAANSPFDAIMLAAAGLKRMDLAGHISEYLGYQVMLPAPGQGAVAVQCRHDDRLTRSKLAELNHLPTQQAVIAERAFLDQLGAGCSLPVGAIAKVENNTLIIDGLVASLDGRQVIRVSHRGPADSPERIGSELAKQALRQGARSILEALRAQSTSG